ncbi:MAG TPA: hypothetical protein VFE24_07660 [Pirellulales bacterium]|jgi:D-alanine-D-alanine ligase|nr:hypothetical protein [Pirellulales bacterium]
MNLTILYNEPTLSPDHADYASEAGVLESVAALSAALAATGHEVRALGVRGPAERLWPTLLSIRADVIINLVEGLSGDSRHEPHVAGCLELLGIPYTGSPPDSLALVHDKVRTKRLLLGAGLPTAPFWRLEAAGSWPSLELEEAIQAGPLFVKPAAEDASLGIDAASVVHELDALRRKAHELHERFGPVLIEQYLPGREFNVSVVALPHLEVLPLAEIEFLKDATHPWPIVTYDSKWVSDGAADRATPVRCPAHVAAPLADALRTLARFAFIAGGCRDYARIDLRTNDAGEPFILEINANPDIGPAAGFARALRAAGYRYQDFAEGLVSTAAARGARA